MDGAESTIDGFELLLAFLWTPISIALNQPALIVCNVPCSPSTSTAIRAPDHALAPCRG
jgi:hypothetical protein